MPLYLATHYIEVPTARVPLCVVILNDAVKRKSFPSTIRCRMVIPSCGTTSISLWDSANAEEVEQWCSANLEQDCITTVAEVPEEFGYGLSLELATSRAADKVATSSRNTLDRINTAAAAASASITEKLDRLDQKTNIISATREATSAAVTKVKAATDRAIETEAVQSTVAAVQTGVLSVSASMGRAFSWVGSKVKESFPSTTAGSGPAATQSYAYGTEEEHSGVPYSQPAQSSPPAFGVPVSRPVGDSGQEWGAQPGVPVQVVTGVPVPQFTLQDDGAADGAASPTREASTGGLAGEGNDAHAATAQQQGAAADPSAEPPVSTGTTQH